MAIVDPKEPTTVGRYTLRHRLAEGGMGAVYLAQNVVGQSFAKWLAIKVVHPRVAEDPAFVNMFMDEARIAAMLTHPNVAQVFDFGSDNGRYFLTMEYLHGESLSAVARAAWAHGGMPTLFAARVVADAARGLHAAHELTLPDGRPAGIVHRDVSPQNIFVLYDGVSKIVDFGIAKSNERLAERTATDVLKGKIAYMAPEQLRREQPDRRLDVFALGIVLWEITLGKRLFRADNEAATIMMIANGEIKRPSELASDYPPELERIVMKALERDKNARYQSCAEMAKDLERFIASRGIPFGPPEASDYMRSLFAEAIRERDRLLSTASVSARRVDAANERTQAASGSLSFENGGAAAAVVVSDDAATVADRKPPVRPPLEPTRVEPAAANVVERMSGTPLPPVSQTARPRATGARTLMITAGALVVLLGISVALYAGGAFRREASSTTNATGDRPATAPDRADSRRSSSEPDRHGASAAARDPNGSGVNHEAVPSVHLFVSATPADARITLDGQPVNNPLDADFPASNAPHELSVSATGFESERRPVSLAFSQRIEMQLRRPVAGHGNGGGNGGGNAHHGTPGGGAAGAVREY